MNRYRQLTSGERYALSALRNKGTTRQPLLVRWVDIEVRSAAKCDGTRRIEGVESIDRIWPMTTPDGDAADRAAMSALAHQIGSWSRPVSSNSGALSRLQAGCDVRGSSRSATRPSTATFGAIEGRAEAYICICAVRPSNAENGTDPTIPEVGWLANDRYLSVQLEPRTEAGSATSKPIPSSATSPTSTASSRSSTVRAATS